MYRADKLAIQDIEYFGQRVLPLVRQLEGAKPRIDRAA